MITKANQKERFLKLVYNEQAIIHKICHLYANSKEDKQDLFQDIVIQLWNAFPEFRNEARITTWIYRVALNTALSRLRREKNKPLISTLDKTSLEIGETTDQDKEKQVVLLYEAIGQLPEIDRAIILLYLEKRSYQEIADIMGLSVGNISVRLVRIRARLEQILQPLK